MSDKRVYELAKELGIESKELIKRLETLGIAVKSHASTLDEESVARVLRESGQEAKPKKVVEKRIKSTVIRRRMVRKPVEAPKAAEEKVLREELPEEKSLEMMPERKVEVAEERGAGEETAEKGVVSTREELKGLRKGEAETPGREEVAVAVQKAEISESVKEGLEEKVEIKDAEKIIAVPSEKEKVLPEASKVSVKKTPSEKKFAEKAPSAVDKKKIEPAKDIQSEAGERTDKSEMAKQKKKGKKIVEVVLEEKKEIPKRKQVHGHPERAIRKPRKLRKRGEKPLGRKEEKESAVEMRTTEKTVPKAIKRRIKIEEAIRVSDLAKRMGVKSSDVISKLIALGIMATINQSIDVDVAGLVAAEFDYQVETVETEYEEAVQKMEALPEKLQPRPPVVTIMGHVDHGKTSLLDAIRETNVIAGESGGITQAIGAYHVHINDRDIVFIDTPGHEAFTAMRARGAQVTDIVVLVVAADDGVMEQTVEAINHSKAAGVPILVAVNKIDKPGADPDRIKQQLSEYGLIPESWGGDVIYAEVSAKQRLGIEELLELILLQADVMELQADPDRPARGIIIEAKLDKGRGPVATVIVQEGTLKEGDSFVSRAEYGRVRAMINDKGQRVKQVGPAMPVEVIGFSKVPQVGNEFMLTENEKSARSISEYWLRKEREKELSKTSKITLEQLYERIKEGGKEFNVILKGDVQGSIEALAESLTKLGTEDVKVRIIHSSTGAITETDVMLASASDAIIIGFKVRPDARVLDIIDKESVDVKLYDVIYDAISDVKAAMEGLLEPIYREVIQGHAEVRQLFKVPKVGIVSGSYVTDGKITRSSNLRLLRDGVVIYDGKLLSLKRFKDDAKEVLTGFECGIGIEGFNDIKLGDVIEAYIKEAVARKLE